MTYEINSADLGAAGLLVIVSVGRTVTASADDFDGVALTTPNTTAFSPALSLTHAEALDLAWGLIDAIEFREEFRNANE